MKLDIVFCGFKNDAGGFEGKFVVIIGRRTFSAAQNLATRLDLKTNAVFVGEATGSKPNHYGETHVARLA